MSARSQQSPDPQDASTQEVSLRLKIMDMQIVDVDDLPVGRVDDIEIDTTGPPRVGTITALLIGQRHLGPRVGGLAGEMLTWVARRLMTDQSAGEIHPSLVGSWRGLLKLRRSLADLELAPLEKWLASHVVRRIPGARDEGI